MIKVQIEICAQPPALASIPDRIVSMLLSFSYAPHDQCLHALQCPLEFVMILHARVRCYASQFHITYLEVSHISVLLHPWCH